MRPFFNIVVIAAMLANSTLGCCVHHAQASLLGNLLGVNESPEVSHCSHGRHEHEQVIAEPVQGERSHRDAAHDDEGECSFARTESAPQFESLALHDSLSMLVTTPMGEVIGDHAQNRQAATNFDGLPGSPRWHLALCVMLI